MLKCYIFLFLFAVRPRNRASLLMGSFSFLFLRHARTAFYFEDNTWRFYLSLADMQQERERAFLANLKCQNCQVHGDGIYFSARDY